MLQVTKVATWPACDTRRVSEKNPSEPDIGRLEPALSRDGAQLWVRLIEPDDRDALDAFVRELSDESRYRRFLRSVKRLAASELTHLCELDHVDAEALLAFDSAGGIVGVARYFRLADRPEAAEVAVTVADEWQHRGVGTLLLRRLVVLAESHGIDHFVATCLATNADMILLLRELDEGIHRIGSGAGAIEVEIRLPTDAEHLIVPTLGAVARAPDLAVPHPSPSAGEG